MASQSALMSRAVSNARPVAIRKGKATLRQARRPRVATQASAISTETTSGYSAEQLAFLERKKTETGGSYSAPDASPASGGASSSGFSAEQLAFLERKKAEFGGAFSGPAAPAAAPPSSSAAGGYSAEQLDFLERQKAEKSGTSSYSAPAAPAPAAPAPAGGYSAEQLAFLERQKAEKSGASSYSAPAAPAPAAPAPAGGYSPEQLAFLERKKAEGRAGYSAPSAPEAAPPTPASAGGYSPEQLAFLERKKAETGASYSAAAATPAAPTDGPSSMQQFIHASLDYFALHQLQPKGRRKNVDVGDPYDFARALVKGKCGSWACSEGGWDSPSPRPTTEVFYVFSGEGCVSDPDGTPHPFGPGDVVILPKGWYGRWDITRKIHKVWMIHDHVDIPGASVTPVVVPFKQMATDAAVSGLNLRMDAVNGMPVTTSNQIYAEGDASVGFWSCSSGTFPCTKKATEYFHVIEGDFDLINADGTAKHCQAGDTVVLPKGWTGTWDVFEKVKKVWVTIQD